MNMVKRSLAILLMVGLLISPCAAQRPIVKGSTDQSVVIRIIDAIDGTPETSVNSSTTGLALEYRREGNVSVPITESDLTLLSDAHLDGGMLHIGNGYYRVDVPDLAFASGADGVLIHGTASDMVIIGTYVPLIGFDLQARGDLVLRTTVTGPVSQTSVRLAAASDLDDDYIGMRIIIRDNGDPLNIIDGVVTDYAYEFGDRQITFDVDGTASFTIAGGDFVEILATGLSNEDRGTAAAILVDTGTTLDDLVDDLESRLTSVRAGYLDSLNSGVPLSAAAVDAVWDELITSGHAVTGSAAKILVDVFNFLDGAPTFGEAMDGQGYTATRANHLDNISTGPIATPSVLVSTTVDGAPANQTTFVLAAGSADNNAYNGALLIVTDSANSAQKAVGLVKAYDGATRTVTLFADPGIFTFAAGDKVDVIASGAAVPLWLGNAP